MENRNFYKVALKNCLTYDDVKYVWAVTPVEFLDEDMYILGMRVSMEGLLLALIPKEKRTVKVCRTAITLDCEAFSHIPEDIYDDSIIFMAIRDGYSFWNLPTQWQMRAGEINSEMGPSLDLIY
jgi:hypothetical protein